MSLKHLKNIDYVIENAEHIKINEEGVERLKKEFQKDNNPYWIDACPFKFDDLNKKELLNAIFFYDSVGFSYWNEPQWLVDYQDNNSDRGSWSMWGAIRRAIDEEIPILDFKQLSNLSSEWFEHIFRGKDNVEIPLLKSREYILKTNAIIIQGIYQGDLMNLIEESKFDAVNLTKILVNNFHGNFKDKTTYKGKEVTFNKRAQLFAADVHYKIKPLKRIEELSGCADYKKSIVYKYFGALEFSEELEKVIENNIELDKNNPMVTETRVFDTKINELMKGDKSAMQANNYSWLKWQFLPKKKQNHLRYRSTSC